MEQRPLCPTLPLHAAIPDVVDCQPFLTANKHSGNRNYQPTDITAEARQVARAYDQAVPKEKAMVRMALDLPPLTGGKDL